MARKCDGARDYSWTRMAAGVHSCVQPGAKTARLHPTLCATDDVIRETGRPQNERSAAAHLGDSGGGVAVKFAASERAAAEYVHAEENVARSIAGGDGRRCSG